MSVQTVTLSTRTLDLVRDLLYDRMQDPQEDLSRRTACRASANELKTAIEDSEGHHPQAPLTPWDGWMRQQGRPEKQWAEEHPGPPHPVPLHTWPRRIAGLDFRPDPYVMDRLLARAIEVEKAKVPTSWEGDRETIERLREFFAPTDPPPRPPPWEGKGSRIGELCGVRLVVNPDVPPGLIREYDGEGSLLKAYWIGE